MRDIVDVVSRRTGLDDAAAREAIGTVRDLIAPGRRLRAEELYFRLAKRLGVSPARAVEVAQIACHAIGASLDREQRERLLEPLTADLRALFAPPPSMSEPAGRPPGLPATGRTLAEGRPGSEHPLSESRPGSAHPLSQAHPPARRVR